MLAKLFNFWASSFQPKVPNSPLKLRKCSAKVLSTQMQRSPSTGQDTQLWDSVWWHAHIQMGQATMCCPCMLNWSIFFWLRTSHIALQYFAIFCNMLQYFAMFVEIGMLFNPIKTNWTMWDKLRYIEIIWDILWYIEMLTVPLLIDLAQDQWRSMHSLCTLSSLYMFSRPKFQSTVQNCTNMYMDISICTNLRSTPLITCLSLVLTPVSRINLNATATLLKLTWMNSKSVEICWNMLKCCEQCWKSNVEICWNNKQYYTQWHHITTTT